MKTALDLRSTNSLWASVLVEVLVRSGVRHAVISPGSRSTPLTMALARHPGVAATPILDERSAGFFSLGLAKALEEPVLLVCTSGTAAANYFPAVIEAHESAVPLLVISADRPPELRACASGQTIDQQKLFGDYVGFFHEFALPELDAGRFRYLRQTVVHAVQRTLSPQAGPVHLNAPFRDPLAPLPDGGAAERFSSAAGWETFFAGLTPPTRVRCATGVPTPLPGTKGIVVVGPSQPADDRAFAEAVGKLAAKLGWPVLADGLSPIRNHADLVPGVITTYDVILRNAGAARALKPDVVIGINGWPTSKVLRGWLEAVDATTWLASERVDNRDALHGRTRLLSIGVPDLASALWTSKPDGACVAQWQRLERQVREGMDERLGAATEMVEPKAAWLLARNLPEGTPLFIANSMPVRDVEYVWPAAGRRVRPLCNRGANGIDGTLSTAAGVATATRKATVLLTGDLALLHDGNGFLTPPRAGSLTIVLINNRGGGIFEHLPVAAFEPPFEEFFATPQDVDFAKLCAAHGVSHTAVRDWAHFTALVRELPDRGVRLLEVRTDRKFDVKWRRELFASLAEGI